MNHPTLLLTAILIAGAASTATSAPYFVQSFGEACTSDVMPGISASYRLDVWDDNSTVRRDDDRWIRASGWDCKGVIWHDPVITARKPGATGVRIADDKIPGAATWDYADGFAFHRIRMAMQIKNLFVAGSRDLVEPNIPGFTGGPGDTAGIDTEAKLMTYGHAFNVIDCPPLRSAVPMDNLSTFDYYREQSTKQIQRLIIADRGGLIFWNAKMYRGRHRPGAPAEIIPYSTAIEIQRIERKNLETSRAPRTPTQE